MTPPGASLPPTTHPAVHDASRSHFIRFGFGSVHSFRRRVVASSLFVVFVRSIDRTTYRLDLRVVVVLIAAVPATKVEVFADVANIIVIEIPWRVVPNDDARPRVRLCSFARECEVGVDLVMRRCRVCVSEYYSA